MIKWIGHKVESFKKLFESDIQVAGDIIAGADTNGEVTVSSVDDNAGYNLNLKGGDADGENKVGGGLKLYSGKSTGNAASSNMVIYYSVPTSSGSSLQNHGIAAQIIGNTGVAKFEKGILIDGVTLTAIQSASESFADNDTSIMTSGAINDRINRPSGQIHIQQTAFTDDLSTDEIYVPFNSTLENATATSINLPMIMPVSGRLLKVHFRSSADHSGQNTTLRLKQITNSENWTTGNTGTLGTQTVTGPDTNEVATADFTSSLDSGTNAFNANDMISISIQNASGVGNSKYVVTMVFELNFSSY